MIRLAIAISLATLVSSCAVIPYGSHANKEAGAKRSSLTQGRGVPSGTYLATTDVNWRMDWKCRNSWMPDVGGGPASTPDEACPWDDENFIGIAVSGGGSRSAVFSAAVLFELERHGVLQQADVISSVSGGSYTAAYYALSCSDPDRCPPTVEGPKRRIWKPENTFGRLEKNFQARWIGNWFWPDNAARYWFTYYDRTDIMAETLADNLFDNSHLGGEGFRFRDLNPQRPYLLINATDNTRKNPYARNDSDGPDDLHFSFTGYAFEQLRSSLDQYPIANAVMASSAFPAVFNYTTVKDYSNGGYVHLFDGGASDNLGLEPFGNILNRAQLAEGRLIILVDAYVPSDGVDPKRPDPRGVADYFVDTNAIDTYGTLMDRLRKRTIVDMKEKSDFLHITFEDIDEADGKLYKKIRHIDTSLGISPEDAACLKLAARKLVEKKMPILERYAAAYRERMAPKKFPLGDGYSTEKCDLTSPSADAPDRNK